MNITIVTVFQDEFSSVEEADAFYFTDKEKMEAFVLKAIGEGWMVKSKTCPLNPDPSALDENSNTKG